MKRVLLCGILIAAVCGWGLFGGKPKANESGITRFRFDYNNAFGGSSYSYSVEVGEEILFCFDGQEYYFYGPLSTTVDRDFLGRLETVCRECQIEKWNGFDRVNPHVLDGDGFSLSITFADGETLYASGSNSVPEGYRAFTTQLDALCAPVRDELLDQARQEKIREGITGTLDSLMANFIQKGSFGKDSYMFLLTKGDIRQNNVEVTIHSDSGEFLPAGDYHIYTSLDDELIGFQAVQRLIEQYDLIQWYDYHQTAEDYPDREWFQVSFGFDQGNSIDAYGTLPPVHYDEFRHDFLQLMADMLSNAGLLNEEEAGA